MKRKRNIFFDFILFQIGWFSCVLSSLSPLPLLLPFIGSIPVLIRSIYTQGIFMLLPFMLTCLLMGFIGDACMVYFGFIQFSDYPALMGVPYWMLLLWFNFGLMLRPVFEWFLTARLRCLLGFSIGGALAYYSGHKLGVLHFKMGWYSAIAVGIEWGLASFVFRFLHLEFNNKIVTHDYT